MASNKKILRIIAEKRNFHFAGKSSTIHGVSQGYHFLLMGSSFSESRQHIRILFCAKCRHTNVNLQSFLPKGCQMQSVMHRHAVTIPVKGSNSHNAEQIMMLLERFTDVLAANDYVNCDELGNEGVTGLYRVKGNYTLLTDAAADRIRISLRDEEMADSLKNERFLPGLAGALGCAVLASIVVFLVGKIGYVTAVTSTLLGVGLVYGYKWKGIRLSGKSAALCLGLAVLFAYLTFRLWLASSIISAADIGFAQAFWYGRTLAELSGALDTYYQNLIMMAGMSILGAVIAVIYELSAQKKQFLIEPVDTKDSP